MNLKLTTLNFESKLFFHNNSFILLFYLCFMLRTKCILAPIEVDDGTRISIMSRHTLNDGVTPDVRITPDKYNFWWNFFAPSPKLVGDYYKRGLSFEKYKKDFLEYLRTPAMRARVSDLANRCIDETITLMCIELTPENCHRSVVASECKIYRPELILDIR